METPAEKISIAKSRLIMTQPFFASLVFPMEHIEDYSCKTICTDGKNVRYNPSYIDQKSIDEVVAVLAHEGLHIGMCHHTRGQGKDHKLWNRACDYVINPELRRAHFKLPDNCLMKDDFDGKYAEDIYQILYKEQQNEQNNNGKGDGDGNGNSGGGKPQPGHGQPGNNQQGDEEAPEDWGTVEQNDPDQTGKTDEEAEGEAKRRMVQAMNAAKMAGKTSAGLERLVEDLIETKTPWEEILNRFLAEVAKNDYSWSRPNRRYVAIDAYFPELRSEEMGKVVFAIDTSGSINKEILKIFVSELKSASELFKFPVTIIHCDSRIKHVEELDADEDITPVGGGGTNFIPPFEYVDDNDIECRALVYLTDGRCNQFPDESNMSCLWCIYGDYDNFNPPFGEVIQID